MLLHAVVSLQGHVFATRLVELLIRRRDAVTRGLPILVKAVEIRFLLVEVVFCVEPFAHRLVLCLIQDLESLLLGTLILLAHSLSLSKERMLNGMLR